jgi:hypothetical protein
LVEGGGPLRTSSTWRVCSAALAEASSNSRGNHRTGPKGPSYRQLFAILGTKWTYAVVSLSNLFDHSWKLSGPSVSVYYITKVSLFFPIEFF